MKLLASSMNPALGEKVAFTLEIQAINGEIGGFYVKLDGGGTLQVAAGSGVQSFDSSSIGHSSTKAASGGVVRFAFDWIAPSTPGGVVVRASAVSGNGDNTSRGDGVGEAQLLLAYGCSGQLYTADPDGDGFGDAEYGQRRDCSAPAGYAARDGDCVEYEPTIHPEAAERCNDKDDDCDGKLDEGLPIGPQYRDADGDGYGAGADSIMDCSSPKGYAADSHDCDDHVAMTHPNAEEVCNFVDDDCDGRTDEGVRPACGVGWCRRYADSCTASICTPGKPRAEECNLLDDDCDDKLDEDAICPGGGSCKEGRCQQPSATATNAGSRSDPEPDPERPAEPSGAAGAAGSGTHANANTQQPTSGASDEGGCSIARLGSESSASWPAFAFALACLLFATRRRHASSSRPTTM